MYQSVSNTQQADKLTNEHVYLNGSQKMRNKLGYDVLDEEMLNLMMCHKSSLSTDNGKDLDGAVEFLQQTSVLVSMFRDPRPITDMGDQRLSNLKGAYMWFKDWYVKSARILTPGDDTRNTLEIRDLDFMYHGFASLSW